MRKCRQILYLKSNVTILLWNAVGRYSTRWFKNIQFVLFLNVGCSLTTVVLQLLALGVQDPLHFDFMDKPPAEVSFFFFKLKIISMNFLFILFHFSIGKQLIEGAMRELFLLGGIQSTDKPVLTEVGQQMAAFPLDPRFTKLILASKEHGCT